MSRFLASPAIVWALLSVAAPGVAQETPPSLRLEAASIEEREIEVGTVVGREVTAWVRPAALPPCAAGVSVRYGFLLDPLDDRHALPDSTRAFTPDARLEIRCDPAVGGWTASFGEVGASDGSLEVRVPIEDLPAVDLLWVAYATDGGRSWFLPDPGADGLGRSARFSIYEIAKW